MCLGEVVAVSQPPHPHSVAVFAAVAGAAAVAEGSLGYTAPSSRAGTGLRAFEVQGACS